jgi:hypothetical protein
MCEALQVLSAALDVARDRERAICWYRNSPLPEFQHRTAEQLIADPKTEAVLSYLGSIGWRNDRRGITGVHGGVCPAVA